MGCIMTIDAGTTSVKTCLFSENISLIAVSSKEYELLTPGKDMVEIEPEIYWDAMKEGIHDVLLKSGKRAEEIMVLTITTQGETMVPVDKEGKPLHNAIVWLDTRAAEESAIIGSLIDTDEFYRNTGLPEISPACPVSKILWFKRNRSELYEKVYKFLLLEDYLLFRLTGEYVTELSLMSSTGYFNINDGKLWRKVLNTIGINGMFFPDILPCGKVIGNVTIQSATELGLSTSTVISTCAMDQISSAIGAGNIYPGIVTETTGTALAIGATADKADYDNAGRVNIYRHYNESFLILPYCPTAGIVLKWFKDEFCEREIKESDEKGRSVYQLLDEAASNVKPGADGLVLIPHLAGSLSPDINPYARGVFFGIGLETKKPHFIRAILESIGYMLRENLELLEAMGIKVREIRSLGGGSGSKLWNSIKADIIYKHITVMEQPESTSLGAAILGAVSVGLYDSVEEACKLHVRSREIYTPNQANSEMYNKSYTTYRAVYNRLKELKPL